MNYQLHFLGHVHLSRDGVPVPVSRKTLALLAYLTLERVPHHRDHLASLLWDNASALLNLRVELTRLRQQGIDVIPARTAMLHVQLPTDVAAWQTGGDHVTPDTLNAWLAPLRGPPLSGLDDLGSSTFRSWLDHQRDQLNGRIEQHCAQVARRLHQHGHTDAGSVLRTRLAELDLVLGPEPLPEPRPAPVPPREPWAAQGATLRGLLQHAHHEPQCVFVWGQRGSARSLVSSVAPAAGWKVIQLQYTPQGDHLIQLLLRHLIAGVPAADRAAHDAAVASAASDQRLDVLLGLLSNQTQPVLLALHDLSEIPAWLGTALSLLMDASVPLLVVVSPTTAGLLGGTSLPALDWSRVHQLTLPPLSRADVAQQLRAAHPDAEAGHVHGWAARITQLSEGWPPYVAALLDAPALTHRLPAELGTRIRSQYGSLDAALHQQLAHLAQVQGPFTAQLATTLLGDRGLHAVHAGLAMGLLAHASPHDHVQFPALTGAHDDADAGLTFRSEVVRVALAGGVAPDERQRIRRALAAALLPTRPAMALHYARRVHDPELTARARAALPDTRALTWQRVVPGVARPGPVGPAPDQPRSSTTPNGYRLDWQGATLDVVRRGPTAPPPRLDVTFGTVMPGAWSVALRVDVFRPAADVLLDTPCYAFGLQVGRGPLLAYAPEATPVVLAAPDDRHEEHVYHDGLPLGQDILLSGRHDGPPGPLRVSFHAVDVACTIHALHWNGADLLRGHQPAAGRNLQTSPQP